MNSIARERFFRKVEPEPNSGCWIWIGSRTCGYGNVGIGGKVLKAHRVAWEDMKGAIPFGLELDHKCRNRACVNPGHLEPVTKAVNILRGEGCCAQHARKQKCPRGHFYSRIVESQKARRCGICDRATRRQRYMDRMKDPEYRKYRADYQWRRKQRLKKAC